jgi:Protein of unknown function (DUF3800)
MLREIACDESGSEGEKLVGGNTDVFAHAGVELSAGAAAEIVVEARRRIASPAVEYKANHLLREKNRSVLEWFLGAAGPIYGNAHVYLVDKAFFLIGNLVDVLLGEDVAVAVYREGPRTFGAARWLEFLEAANDLMRPNNRRVPQAAVEDVFFDLVEGMAEAPGRLGGILERVRKTRPEADAYRARLFDDPHSIRALDPLIPAIARTVGHWSADGSPVAIVHDEQPALTQRRIAGIQEVRGQLASLRMVDSQSDERIQVADYLAGTARKIASEELNGRGDARLTALLRPYVDAGSIWADERSGSLLGVQGKPDV